jgi:hypothetical protein
MTAPVFGPPYGIANIIIPRGGPKVVPLSLNFTDYADAEIDGEELIARGKIEFIQGIYIDNADNPNPVSITCGLTGQRTKVKGHTQGYYSVFMPNPPRFVVASTQAAGAKTNLFFYNVPIQSANWATE